MSNVRIDKIEITPNPVNCNARFLIAVTITDIISGLLTSDNYYIETSDGLCLATEGG